MSSRALFSRLVPSSSRPSILRHQVRRIQYTTQFALDRQASKIHASHTADLWRKITLYIAFPAVTISIFNAYKLYSEHHNHKVHGPLPEEKIEFPYQNIRTKAFWWGDGDKTLFWNDKVNYHAKPESGG